MAYPMDVSSAMCGGSTSSESVSDDDELRIRDSRPIIIRMFARL
jgi:hypothetical protein